MATDQYHDRNVDRAIGEAKAEAGRNKLEIDLLKRIFLETPDSLEETHIVMIEGAEAGHDHLRIYTQTAAQAEEDGTAWLYTVRIEEVAEVPDGD